MNRAFLLERTLSTGLFNFSAANASGANLHSLVRPVFIHSDRLNIGFKNTGRHLNDMHTDSPFFLCKTSTNNPAAVEFLFPADFTDIAHYDTSYMLHYLLKTISSILDHTKHARLKVYEYNTVPGKIKIVIIFFLFYPSLSKIKAFSICQLNVFVETPGTLWKRTENIRKKRTCRFKRRKHCSGGNGSILRSLLRITAIHLFFVEIAFMQEHHEIVFAFSLPSVGSLKIPEFSKPFGKFEFFF